MTTATTSKPCTANVAMTDILRRAARKFPRAHVAIQYTTAGRSPLASPCRVVVQELDGSGYTARVKRTLWSGPVANGADAAGVAAWERVFAAEAAVTVTAAEVAAARSHANGDFDLVQRVALRLTDADRAAGRPAPAYGYSAENIARAREMVAAA